jgi:hypothetical protein
MKQDEGESGPSPKKKTAQGPNPNPKISEKADKKQSKEPSPVKVCLDSEMG